MGEVFVEKSSRTSDEPPGLPRRKEHPTAQEMQAFDTDKYLYAVCRYVERNPLRADWVSRADDWPWSSLWKRAYGDEQPRPLLSPWPVTLPGDWVERVNAVQTETELTALRRSVKRGSPFGETRWQQEQAARLGIAHTLRPLGRPKKVRPGEDPGIELRPLFLLLP